MNPFGLSPQAALVAPTRVGVGLVYIGYAYTMCACSAWLNSSGLDTPPGLDLLRMRDSTMGSHQLYDDVRIFWSKEAKQ